MKEKIRPIYSELQGYLSQAPKLESLLDRSSDSVLWTQVNNAINELNSVSGKNYDNFKINPEFMNQSGMVSHQYVKISAYRSKLGGLIARLHAEYFADEIVPFSGMPSTVITQQQTQSQVTYVQILLDIQSKIDEKLRGYKEGSNEKNFLEKVKDSLSKVGNIVELLALILRTGKEFGLTIEQVLKLFS